MLLVVCDRVDEGAAQHAKGIIFVVVDLQNPEGFSDVAANKFRVGGGLGLFDALGDHCQRINFGHYRFTKVPTLCLDHLTPAQARAFMIAGNRLTEIATWDDWLLAQQLKDLSLEGLDFSLEVTGGSAGPSVSRLNDLWQLDDHRVLCGNVLEVAAFRLLMGFPDPRLGAAQPNDRIRQPRSSYPSQWAAGPIGVRLFCCRGSHQGTSSSEAFPPRSLT
jgi:hypothetical protein